VAVNPEDIAQAFADNQKEAIKAFVKSQAEDDPEFAELESKFRNSILIDDNLSEHYVPTRAIDATPRRKKEDLRTVKQIRADVANAFNDPNFSTKPYVSTENGESYIIENLLRDPTLITEYTPADVINEIGRMYPTKVGYAEIPPANTVTDGELEGMALAHIHQEAGLPAAMPMDVATRSASPELLKALELAGAFDEKTRAIDGSRLVPIADLQFGGARDRTARRAAGTGPDVRAVILGDKVRNTNPVTGADLGNSFIEDGVRVRPNVHVGHGVPHHETEGTDREYLTHDPSNLGAEGAIGNLGKSSDNKKGVPEDNLAALLRKVRIVKKQRSLKPFVDTLKTRASNQEELMNIWRPLITAVENELI